MNPALVETLRTAQRFGFFGDRPVEQAAEHAMAFVEALTDLELPARLVDLGSGGGLPGLVLADAFPDLGVTLIDRRQKRTDFLQRAVVSLGMEHVEVRCADVSQLIGEVRSGRIEPFDVVTARGFGPPDVTLRSARALASDSARIVISEPPSGDRWPPDLLVELGLCRQRRGAVSVFCDSAEPQR